MWTLAVPLFFSLTTISVVRDGAPVEPARICRFEAVETTNPFRRWIAHGDVACADLSGSIDFPRGRWNVFAEAAGAISAPQLVNGDEDPASLTFALAPAANFSATLPPAHRAVVYAPRLGTGIALEEGRGLVPANEELWLFVVNRSAPVALFPVAARPPGADVHIDATVAAPPALVGWLSVPEAHRAAIERASGLKPPLLRARFHDGTREADPLPDVSRLHGAFIRFRDVIPGDADITVGGRGWVPDGRRARVSSAFTPLDQPLLVRATGTLVVHWTIADDLAALERSLGSCDREEPARLEVIVSSCRPPRDPRDVPDEEACMVVRSEPLDLNETFGAVRIDEVTPGLYRAEARYGKLPRPKVIANVTPLTQADLSLRIDYEEIHGDLTRGGEPLEKDAAIHFPGGYGFSSARSGEYRAVLLGLSGIDAQIRVGPCDAAGGVTVLAGEPMQRNTRFNIDIPANRLEVLVTDTFTREPIDGATVRVEVTSFRVPRRPVITRLLRTGSGSTRGRAVMDSIPERELWVSASHAAYQKSAIDRFTVGRSDEKSIEIQLVPLRGNNGRVMSSRPFDSGAIYWYSPAGREIERAELAADGTFIYSTPHASDETMVVVSLSHPLWVSRAPAVPRFETMEVQFPDGPSRSFEVSRLNAASGSLPITVAAGGIRVPPGPFRQHQFLRGHPAELRGPGPLPVTGIAETGPIEVFIGTSEKAHRLGADARSVILDGP